MDKLTLSLTSVIVFFILIYYIIQYRRYVKEQTNLTWPRKISTCPDYWVDVGNNKCKNTFKIGKCAIKSNTQNPFVSTGYIGCFNDKAQRDFSIWHKPNNYMTKEQCRAEAVRQGKAYYAMQYPQGSSGGKAQCFVGDTYGKYGKVDDNKCRYNNQLLGGGWLNAVYETNKSIKTDIKKENVSASSFGIDTNWRLYFYPWNVFNNLRSSESIWNRWASEFSKRRSYDKEGNYQGISATGEYNGEWLEIKFPYRVSLKSFKLESGFQFFSSAQHTSIKSFRLYGTNDFKNYDVILEVKERNSQEEFYVDSGTSYTSFRIAVNKIYLDNGVNSSFDGFSVTIKSLELNGERDDTNDVVDFSSPFYQNNVNKCRWSRKCNTSWEGIDKLCS